MSFKARSVMYFLLDGAVLSAFVIFAAGFCPEEILIRIGILSFLVGGAWLLWNFMESPGAAKADFKFLRVLIYFLPFWLFVLGICMMYYAEAYF